MAIKHFLHYLASIHAALLYQWFYLSYILISQKEEILVEDTKSWIKYLSKGLNMKNTRT